MPTTLPDLSLPRPGRRDALAVGARRRRPAHPAHLPRPLVPEGAAVLPPAGRAPGRARRSATRGSCPCLCRSAGGERRTPQWASERAGRSCPTSTAAGAGAAGRCARPPTRSTSPYVPRVFVSAGPTCKVGGGVRRLLVLGRVDSSRSWCATCATRHGGPAPTSTRRRRERAARLARARPRPPGGRGGRGAVSRKGGLPGWVGSRSGSKRPSPSATPCAPTPPRSPPDGPAASASYLLLGARTCCSTTPRSSGRGSSSSPRRAMDGGDHARVGRQPLPRLARRGARRAGGSR